MHHAVPKCPKLNNKCEGIKISASLDLGSEVLSLYQSSFKKYVKCMIHPSITSKTEACSLLKLTAADDGQLPATMSVKLYMDILELKVPKLGFLITKDLNHILETEHHKSDLGRTFMGKIQWTQLRKILISDNHQEMLGQVMVGDKTPPICVTDKTTITVPGKINQCLRLHAWWNKHPTIIYL